MLFLHPLRFLLKLDDTALTAVPSRCGGGVHLNSMLTRGMLMILHCAFYNTGTSLLAPTWHPLGLLRTRSGPTTQSTLGGRMYGTIQPAFLELGDPDGCPPERVPRHGHQDHVAFYADVRLQFQ